MELLRAAVPSIPEFTSLSIVFRPGDVYNDLSMADPMILPSPLSSISASLARSALQELHASVTATLRRAPDGAHATTAESSHVVAETFKDDLKLLDDLQVFRPLATYGLGVVYKFIRGDAAAALTAKLAGVLLAAHKSNAQAEPLKTADEDILGILLCVGVSGMAVSSVTSLTHYQLSERLNACRDILNSMGPTTVDVSAVKTLLSTLLLLEDDARLTNGRADAVLLTSIPEIDEAHEKKGGLMSPLVGRRASVTKQTAADQADKEQVPLTLTLNSSDMVRTVAENMKVLSVAETDSILRKYAVSGLERKATLDLLGGGSTSSSKSSRFSRKRLGGRDADLDQFDYKGPFKETIQSSGVATVPLQGASQGHQPQQSQGGSSLPVPRKDTKGKTAPALSAPKGDHTTGRRGKGQFTDDESSQQQQQQQQQAGGAFDPFGQRPRGPRQKFEDDNDTVGSTARLQVNIALNEDLSCSYRSSQLSSCTVEGVVQVQVKSSSKTTVPFFLLMKDPARHVESFVQNKKFADDVSASLMAEEDADRKFTVSVPKDDSYFPVVRYKCTDELRPVPMVRSC
jgi:hypothetical protein